MEQNQKPSFADLVKSEVQDLDESLSSIPNLWGENPRQLIDVLITSIADGKMLFDFNESYTVSPSIKQKVQDIFFSDRWI